MKAYYYLLFRIYRYYKDKQNENDFQAIFSAFAISTLIISLVLFFFHGLLNYFDLLPMYPNKFYMILFMVIIGFINYYFFVKDKRFLEYGFQKDKKGGVYIIITLIFLGISLLILSNVNREKIFGKKRNPLIEQRESSSLEGKIRRWFEGNN
ncbi:hypothetical protein QWZ06_21520 [Chryseobacterium tructae]|uniref:DUF805 domain-containing protein n=1 Tax=Chryseobacterium tructae TaxID=1037380 RepID=A0ABV7Y141_9FLAO|nr:hypothetical protein [Chryseobacterium tructae]MDN3694663.1 hypothetical protein [Chryseobacterium tructae]